jgi:YD repeat-containing protein
VAGKYGVALPATTAAFENYEYIVQYLNGNQEVVGIGGGVVERSPTPIPVAPTTFTPSNTRITGITADRLAISWDVRPGTPKFEWRLPNSGDTWAPLALKEPRTNPLKESVSVAGQNGQFDWRISYTDAGGLTAIEYGTLNISSPQPTLTNQTASQITLTSSPGRISWTKPAGTSDPTILVREVPSTTWVSMPPHVVFLEGSQQILDLGWANPSNTEVLISYKTGEVVTHLMRGMVTTPVPGQVIPTLTNAVAVDSPTAAKFSWNDLPAAGTPSFQYKLRTDVAWKNDLAPGPVVEGKRSVNITTLNGSYDYRVVYTATDGVVAALATGVLDVVQPQAQLSATDGAVLKNMGADATRWSWDKPAQGSGAGTLRFRQIPSGTWSEPVPVATEGNRDYINLVGTIPGNYEYIVSYHDGKVETAFSTGTMVIAKPMLGSVDRADIQVTPSAGRLTWVAKDTGTPKFQYRAANTTGAWLTLDPEGSGATRSVNLAGLNGTFDYRIFYDLGDNTLSALDAGRMTVAAGVPTLQSQDAAKLSGFDTSTTQLWWNARSGGSMKVEYRSGSLPFEDISSSGAVFRGVNNRDGVDLSRFGSLNGEFRITYTEGGLVTAMAIGTIVAGGWSAPVPLPSSNVTGAVVQGTSLTWTSSHPGTPQFFYKLNNGSWVQGQMLTNTSANLAPLLGVGGTHEYRIVYSQGTPSNVSALGRGQLTVTLATAGLGTAPAGRVENFLIGRKTVSWATPSGALGLPVVDVRQAGGQWGRIDPLSTPNSFDISRYITSGTWEVRVAYENGGQPTHIGIASFALSSPAITAETSSDILGISTAPGPKLIWTVPSVQGTPKLEYFDNGTWIDAAQAQAGTLTPNDGLGRAVFNFELLSAKTYQFRITYSGGDGYTAFASGRIQFFGGTAQPYVDQLGQSFFGASIQAGVGELRWTPPANVSTPFQAYAAYRVAGTNSTWTPAGEVKSRTGNVHFVDISQIGQGNYEFRIHYESTSQVIAGATPRVEIKAAPSRLNDALGSLGAFGLVGTQLTWSFPSLGGTPVFEYLTLSGWLRGPNVGTYGGKPSVNIQGIHGSPVQFRVRYTGSDGSNLAFGTGTFTATPASQVLNGTDAKVVGFKVEGGKLKWDQPTGGGTAVFWWQPAAGGTWSSEVVGTEISVASIGSGTYNWRLVYTNGGVETAFASGTMTVPEKASVPVLTKADIGPVTARPNSSMLQWPPSTVAGAVPLFQVWQNGAWQNRPVDTTSSTMHAASVKDFIGTNLAFRIQYSVPGAAGQPEQPVGLVSGQFNGVLGSTPVLTETFSGEVEGVSASTDGTRLNWTAPGVGGTVTVQTRRLGDPNWGMPRAVSGTSADIAGLNNEVNEFRIVYRDANQVITAMAMGTLVPQNARVDPAATTNVSGFDATRMQLSWDRPAGFAGMTELFQYFDSNTQRWVGADPIVDLGNNRRALNFPEMTGVSIRYRVVYKDPATGEIKALGTGTFTVGAISQPSLQRIVSTVGEPLLLAGRLVWERPASAPANSTAVFERKVNGIWTPLVPTALPSQAPTHHRVELSELGAGTHEWRVKYVDPTTGFVHAIGSGTVVVSAAAQVTEPALGNITDVQADRQRLSWVAPPVSAGTLLVEAYDPGSGTWQSAMHLFSLVDGRPGVDIAGLTGTVKFRVSYGFDVPNEERRIMALATGEVSNVAGTASYTQTPSPVGSFSIANGELIWLPGVGTVEVHRRLEGSTDWTPITSVNTYGTRHKLTIGGLDVGRYEYRVVYKQGSSVTAMDMTGVLVGAVQAVARPPMSVSAAVAGIGGFSVPAGTSDIRWTRSTVVGITGATFEYREWGSDTWKTAPIAQAGTLDSVNIGALTLLPAGYEFRVQYSTGQGIDTKVVAKIQGRFNLAPPVMTTAKPTLQLLAAPAVLAAPVGTINSITWAAPSNSNGQKAVLETRLVTENEWGVVNVTRGGATDGATFNQVVQASAFEYRITYTDAAGVVTAIGSGVMNFGNANVTRPTPDVVITTATYTPYRPASPAVYEVLSVTTPTTPNSISDPRLGFTASASGGDAPGAYSIRPKVEQLRDRWGNVIEVTDPRNAQWKTSYRWNWNNQLIEQARPADGSVDNTRATTRIYYDALGREVGVRDARGYLNSKVYDKAGNLVEERQADGGVTTHFYDALGNKVRTTDAEGNAARRTADGETEAQAAARKIGRTTDFGYDGMGRLTQVTHGKANVYSVSQDANNLALTLSAPDWRNITETYEYDEVGRKTKQTNGNNEVTRYRYDSAGHVVEVQQQVSGTFRTVSRTTYDANGFRESEMDANGVRAQTWTNDAFGRVLSHTDLSGVRTTYTYDNAKLLQRVGGEAHTVAAITVPGQNQEFKYDQAGQLLEINDIGVGRVSTYRYDAAGNRVLERTEQSVDGKVVRLQDNYMGYDAQGRLRLVFDGHLNISFKYDLNGNRTEISTTISVLSAPKSGEERKHDSVRNFQYDEMNRQTMVEEYVENGGADGKGGKLRHDITYYYDGNRKSDKFWGNKVAVSGGEDIIVSYDTESGYVTYNTTTPITYEKTVGLTEEKYQYDNLGRLKSVFRDGTQVDLRLYDGAGRAVQTGSPGNLPTDYATKLNEGIPEPEQVGAQMRLSKYDEQGRLVFQNTYRSDGRFKSGMDYRNLGDGTGYDAAGNLLGFRVHVDGAGMTETHKFSHGLFDGYVVATETATDHKNRDATATSRIDYDTNGHQKRITDSGKSANDRTIYNDAGGRALLVDQGGNLQRQLIVNGEVLGNYGIGLDDLKPKDSNRNPVFAAHVDFEWGYQQINGNYPGASPGSYTVRQGDTLQGIARGAYGDSRMWYRIAEANGLSSDSDLKVGQTLVIPTGVGGVHNASDTFEPYDPSKVVGDTSPTLPVPAAKKGCGGIGMILMIVVAVVVTIFTAGVAAAYFAPAATAGMSTMGAGMAALGGSLGAVGVGAAAIGGAVGSIASQLVGKAAGVVDHFSWKQVAISAIGAGVTAGVGVAATGTSLGGTGFGATVARAAIGNAASQGIGVAMGLQEKFSWRNVAASAVGAGVGHAVGGALSNAWGGTPIGDFAARAVTGFAAGAAAAAMRGGRFSVQQVAADAFGNALGNAVVDGMTSDRDPSNSNYRNEFDRESDAAHDARQWAELNRTGGNFARMDGASYRGESSLSPVFGGTFSEDAAMRRAFADPYGFAAGQRDAAATARTAQALWGAVGGGRGRTLTDTSSESEIQASLMRQAGFDDYELIPTGGGSVRVTPGGGGGPTMVNGISVNRRADAAFQAAGDLMGMGQMYRDYKLLGALMADAQQQAIIDRMKGALQERMGMMRNMPTEAGLGASPIIDANGVVRYDPADLIDRYGDALRKVAMWKQGIVELDTRSMLITSIGNERMGPMQWVEENTQRYQRAYAAGLEEGKARYAKGTLPFRADMPEQLQTSIFAHQTAERAVIRYNQSIGVPEGPGQLVSMNRWAYDPGGSGMTVRPDMLLDLGPSRPGEVLRFVVDGKSSAAEARASGAQFTRTGNWLGGASIKAATPEGLLPWTPRKGR